MITVLKFLVISEFQWRHAEMIFHVFTKKGWVRKTEAIADLLDAQVGLLQVQLRQNEVSSQRLKLQNGLSLVRMLLSRSAYL